LNFDDLTYYIMIFAIITGIRKERLWKRKDLRGIYNVRAVVLIDSAYPSPTPLARIGKL
jgi:hypothetical protein